MTVRQDQYTSAIVEDLSVLCLGAMATAPEYNFSLIGRIQLLVEESIINFWYVQFPDLENGWLLDWEGGYALVKYHQLPNDLKLTGAHAGNNIKIGNSSFEVRRKCKHLVTFTEGVLPKTHFISKTGFLIVEAGNLANEVLVAVIYGSASAEAFSGKFMPYQEFKFVQVRPHHEWIS